MQALDAPAGLVRRAADAAPWAGRVIYGGLRSLGFPDHPLGAMWRAADLLREPGATLGSVAHQVGYSSPYALSTAFKRSRGISPRDHRLAAAV